MKRIIKIILIIAVIVPNISYAKVFLTKDKALKLSFPEATDIESRQIFLSKDQLEQIEQVAKTKIDSKFYIFYIAKKNEEEIGYAVVDTHTLRTSTETVLFVINKDGKLEKAEILAFFEPQDYMQGERWMTLFFGKDLDSTLKIGKDVPNITGATITSHSFADATRKVLAIYDVVLKNDQKYTKKDD